MGIALLGLQPDVDGYRTDVAQRHAFAAQALAHGQHLLLIDGEADVDRIDLDQGGEFGRLAGADHGARIDEASRHNAVEGGDDCGVGEVALGLLDLALGLGERGLGRVALGAQLIEERDRRRRRLDQIFLALEVGVGLDEQRLLLRLGGLRDLKRDLVVLLVDLEKHVALFDEGAVLVADGVEKSLHPRHEIDAIDRSRDAGHLHVERDVAALGLGDGDLCGRRGTVCVLLSAGGERQGRSERGRPGRPRAQSRLRSDHGCVRAEPMKIRRERHKRRPAL